MDFLKFNCYDLAEQNAAIYQIYRKMLTFSDELNYIFSSTEEGIKSYENLQEWFNKTIDVINHIAMDVLSANKSLEKITDIYYSAENTALKLSEDLPIEINPSNSNKNYNTTYQIKPSAIDNKALIIEDWLAEFAYKYNN